MPEAANAGISRHRASAVEAVQAWLHEFDTGVRALGKDALDRYRDRALFIGWRLNVCLAGSQGVQLDLLLDERFPRTEPRVALVPGSVEGDVPHADSDGVLCLFPSTESFAITAPVDLVRVALQRAVRLLEDTISKQIEGDLRTEFLSYWKHHTTNSTPPVLSLLDSVQGTRPIRAWCGRSIYVVEESADAVTTYLRRRFPEGGAGFETETAGLLWIERAPLPAEYPRTASDVLELASSTNETARKMLEDLVMSAPRRVVVILGVPTDHGPAFAAVVVDSPSRSNTPGHRGGDPLTAGFRPGRTPGSVISQRFFGRQPLRRAAVERIDPEWIHGRGADARVKRLQVARVAICGCGSVGAPVAIALAQAGVGEIVLIDPQVLATANTGRHVLGAESVGMNKAEALEQHLRRRFPHLKTIRSFAQRWDQAMRKAPQEFATCDLIVSAIGDWSAEGALNEWHVRQGRRQPIVYGWTEAYACAGHAVAILAAGGCLQCGLTEFGEPMLRVTDWPAGPTVRQEPACGSTFQPYGPVELMYVTALVAELSLDCILGSVTESTERLWAASDSHRQRAGGVWSDEWRKLAADGLVGGRVAERSWPRSTKCSECMGGTA
ncbi:MAG: ThiF family adenylyltransferase [Planctomycetes bacterium]|nr:ThiF family adenylyltransferase [Planctomycetota bacterium]